MNFSGFNRSFFKKMYQFSSHNQHKQPLKNEFGLSPQCSSRFPRIFYLKKNHLLIERILKGFYLEKGLLVHIEFPLKFLPDFFSLKFPLDPSIADYLEPLLHTFQVETKKTFYKRILLLK